MEKLHRMWEFHWFTNHILLHWIPKKGYTMNMPKIGLDIHPIMVRRFNGWWKKIKLLFYGVKTVDVSKGALRWEVLKRKNNGRVEYWKSEQGEKDVKNSRLNSLDRVRKPELVKLWPAFYSDAFLRSATFWILDHIYNGHTDKNFIRLYATNYEPNDWGKMAKDKRLSTLAEVHYNNLQQPDIIQYSHEVT